MKPTSSLPASGHAVIFFQKLHLVTDRPFLQDFSELLQKVETEEKSNKDKMVLRNFYAISYRTPWSDSFLSLNEHEKVGTGQWKWFEETAFFWLIILFVWERSDRQIVSCSLPLLSWQFIDLLSQGAHVRS